MEQAQDIADDHYMCALEEAFKDEVGREEFNEMMGYYPHKAEIEYLKGSK